MVSTRLILLIGVGAFFILAGLAMIWFGIKHTGKSEKPCLSGLIRNARKATSIQMFVDRLGEVITEAKKPANLKSIDLDALRELYQIAEQTLYFSISPEFFDLLEKYKDELCNLHNSSANDIDKYEYVVMAGVLFVFGGAAILLWVVFVLIGEFSQDPIINRCSQI